jgi:hypothetical protein
MCAAAMFVVVHTAEEEGFASAAASFASCWVASKLVCCADRIPTMPQLKQRFISNTINSSFMVWLTPWRVGWSIGWLFELLPDWLLG